MRLFVILVALFVAVPWVEIVLLLWVWRVLGPVETIVLVLGTGVLGAALARRQGTKAWAQVRAALRQGRLPSKELFDGLCVLCAGILLVTPGLLTDSIGFMLLIPSFRDLLRRKLVSRFLGDGVGGGPVIFSSRSNFVKTRRHGEGGDDEVIDVQANEVELDDGPKSR